MADNQILFEIKDLCKSFGDHLVLDHISTTIKQGEVVVIVGPSGSGKSTFLRSLNLLEEPTGGSITFEGLNITDPKCNINKYPQKIGMVFQHFNLFPHKTILQNMTLAPIKLLNKSKEEAEGQAMELLRRVGLEEKANAYPSQLSGGQKQRIAIVRSLCMDPDVILFDEPTSHLDFRNQAIVMKTLQKLSDKGMTIVMTSHFPSHAWQVGTKVVLMGRKGIIAQGTPEEIMTEDNLSDIYDVRVRIVNKQTEGSKAFFCEPCFD